VHDMCLRLQHEAYGVTNAADNRTRRAAPAALDRPKASTAGRSARSTFGALS
jgi:hypothetical protein